MFRNASLVASRNRLVTRRLPRCRAAQGRLNTLPGQRRGLEYSSGIEIFVRSAKLLCKAILTFAQLASARPQCVPILLHSSAALRRLTSGICSSDRLGIA